VRVIFMGTPVFAVPALEQLVLNRQQIVAVYTSVDKPAGRGQVPVASPVKQAALAWGLPVVQPINFKNPAVIAQLAELSPDIIVVVAYGQILPQAVLDVPRYGCISAHPSLLPRFRGASPIPAAILAGDEFTGVSVIRVVRQVDAGPVLAQAQISIAPQDNTATLGTKLAVIAARMLQEAVVLYPRGEMSPRLQNEADVTYCGLLPKTAGEIDWQQPAVDIWRQVRAYYPWPGSYTRWRGQRLKILETVPLSGATAPGAGLVISLTPDQPADFGVGTGAGVLGIIRVQLEGKRVMSAAEFLRGQREFIGAVLPQD